MKAIFDHTELSQALAKAGKATGKGSHLLPILSHVALSVHDDAATMLASDGVQRVAVTLNVDTVTVPGSIAIDAAILGSFLASTDGPVTMDTDGHAVKVNAGKARARINALDVDDVPYFASEASFVANVTLDTGELKAALSAVLTSVAGDESRPVLAGVHLRRTDGGAFTLNSADGFRATRVEVAHLGGTGDIDAVVPARTLRTLAALLSDGAALTLDIAPNLVRADVDDGVQWASHVIDGTFPDLAQLFPKECAYAVEVERKALQQALKAAAPFIKDNHGHIEIESVSDEDGGDERLEVVGVSADRGNVHYDIDATIENDFMPRTGFNADYLAALAGVLPGDTITLSGNGPVSALMVTASAAPGVRSLIMPVVKSS